MSFHIYLLLLLITCGMVATVALKKLSLPAAVTGGILSMGIYAGSGWTGILMMTCFFIIAVLATSWKLNVKIKSGLAETQKGKRTASQVFANAGLAAIIGIVSYIFPQLNVDAPLLIAACFAAATADTVSSELGNIYGSRFYQILSFQKGEKGNNGVVSIEGSMAGLAGSIIIAICWAIGYGWNINVCWIILAGTVGNITDSVLGSLLENKGYINNNTVNFLNTCAAAICILLIQWMSC